MFMLIESLNFAGVFTLLVEDFGKLKVCSNYSKPPADKMLLVFANFVFRFIFVSLFLSSAC